MHDGRGVPEARIRAEIREDCGRRESATKRSAPPSPPGQEEDPEEMARSCSPYAEMICNVDAKSRCWDAATVERAPPRLGMPLPHPSRSERMSTVMKSHVSPGILFNPRHGRYVALAGT
jgi:hypothetical protein